METLNILVVDDNPVSLAFFAEALHQLGHRATSVDNGLRAVEMAAKDRYDVLLIDARMPGLDGIQTLARIRDNDGASAQTVALATTADGRTDVAGPLRQAGFAAVLVKPIRLIDLEHALRQVSNPATPIDEAAALAASAGDPGVAAALRAMFLKELLQLPAELEDLKVQTGSVGRLAERMHRLQASAGFCGAASLQRAAQDLERIARNRDAWPRSEVDDLNHRIIEVVAELRRLAEG